MLWHQTFSIHCCSHVVASCSPGCHPNRGGGGAFRQESILPAAGKSPASACRHPARPRPRSWRQRLPRSLVHRSAGAGGRCHAVGRGREWGAFAAAGGPGHVLGEAQRPQSEGTGLSPQRPRFPARERGWSGRSARASPFSWPVWRSLVAELSTLVVVLTTKISRF